MPSEPDSDPNPLLAAPANSQLSSPLYTIFPPEIRTQIFTYALSSFPDPRPQTHYDNKACYTRPSYFAPHKSDLRLLQTCRAVYSEAWHLPFIVREETHWLGHEDRAPPEYKGAWALRLVAGRVEEAKRRGLIDGEIESCKVFAQMWALEAGKLSQLLGVQGFRPRSVTVTIRHTDWWWWEHDHNLRFEAGWVKGVVLAPSVREIRFELESLERKKGQIDRIVKQMAERWYFNRTDGVTLFPDFTGRTTEVDRWTGPSEFNNRKWTRDESRPGEVDFYCATVVFRPEGSVKKHGGQVHPELAEKANNGLFDVNTSRLQGTDPVGGRRGRRDSGV
jgi:hypothetical protein